MMNKTKNKSKKTADQQRESLRMCAVCRRMFPKRQMIRIVRSPEGVICVDKTGRMNGRGVYLCGDPSCCRMENVRRAVRVSLKTDSVPDLCIGSGRSAEDR